MNTILKHWCRTFYKQALEPACVVNQNFVFCRRLVWYELLVERSYFCICFRYMLVLTSYFWHIKKINQKLSSLRKFWAEITNALYYYFLPKQAQWTSLTLRTQTKIFTQILLAELVAQAGRIQVSSSYWRCQRFTLTAPHLLFRLLLFISLVDVELLPGVLWLMCLFYRRGE